MNWPSDLNPEPLAAIYLVANTPSYLFKHLRRDEAVQQLARTATVDDLAELISEFVSKPERTALDISRVYAALAAMSLRPYREWQDRVEGLDLAMLDWGARFRTLMKGNAVPVMIANVSAPQTIPSPRAQPVSTTESRLTASVPRITVVEK
jgi:hypothetical protein